MRRTRDKKRFLDEAGALNNRPEKIKDEKFQSPDGFFDPLDKVQVKYEMLRSHGVDEKSVVEVTALFGFTRESFYQNYKRFESQGILGLADRKRGRKGPTKLTNEVLQFIEEQKKADPDLSGARLAEMVAEHHSIELHKRTVEKVLHGGGELQKKTIVRKKKRS